MLDYFKFEPWQGVQASSGRWYKAVELLGVGGNAATFLAYSTTEPTKGILYAVKVFRRLSQPERRTSFLAEARILKDCDHPAIMRVFDEGTYYGTNPFIVEEYLPRTLADVMRAGVGIVEKVSYTTQLLSAIAYLAGHVPSVVHRDIKPANIFIKGGSCVLGDFGLMKVLGAEDEDEDKAILKESVGPGMPYYYRTPDLVRYLKGEAALSAKTDVFQLGLVLAQLFTGRNPLRAARNFTDPIDLEPLGNIPTSLLSGSIAALVKRMLTIDEESRPSAGELLDPWQGVFEELVDQAHELEDRVFRIR